MLALIPARGGSKGLPGKNLRLLGGRPLIAHSITAALDAATITRVVVSTDSPDIAAAALAAGAEVPFLRAAELATDTASSLDVCLHAADLLSTPDAPVDALVLLQPTSPLRSPADIDAAVALFRARAAHAVISVTEDPHPIAWTRVLAPDGRLLPHPAFAAVPPGRRQDHPPTFHPNGALYVIAVPFLRAHRRLDSERTFGFPMPPERSVDIDTALDLAFAEALLAARTQGPA